MSITVLDRLVGLVEVISPAVMEQALLDARQGNVPARCQHRVMLWVVLAMGVFTDLPRRSGLQTRAAYATGRRNARRAQSVQGATTPGGGSGPTRL